MKSTEDLNMLTIMNLVRQSTVKNVQRDEVWKALLRQRRDTEIVKGSACLSDQEVAEVIFKTGQDLNIKYDWNKRVHRDDEEFAKELYSVVLFWT